VGCGGEAAIIGDFESALHKRGNKAVLTFLCQVFDPSI
jgi:hypothetical protein